MCWEAALNCGSPNLRKTGNFDAKQSFRVWSMWRGSPNVSDLVNNDTIHANSALKRRLMP
jgi:hypothetical protein